MRKEDFEVDVLTDWAPIEFLKDRRQDSSVQHAHAHTQMTGCVTDTSFSLSLKLALLSIQLGVFLCISGGRRKLIDC